MRLNHGQFLIDGVYPSPVAVHDRAGSPALHFRAFTSSAGHDSREAEVSFNGANPSYANEFNCRD
jgi:hypothetical protein